MVVPLSRNPLDTGIQNALMTPNIVSIDSVLQLVLANNMQGDPRELDNQPKGYSNFVSISNLYHTIIVGYAIDPWFSNLHNLRHFVFENHI